MSELELEKIYYDPSHPAAYGGVASLVRATGLKPEVVKKWLKGQSTYTLHKPARIRYSTRKYYVSGIDHQWQMDLVDMQAHPNDGYKYILTVIDIFSRYGWALPIKSKSPRDVKPAFEQIFSTGRKPLKAQSDQGLEFESGIMQPFWKEHNIHQFSVKSAYKPSIVERFNRTIKTKMWRYFTHNNTYRWLEILPKLIDGYNNSVHRTIMKTPNQVSKENEIAMWMRQEPMGVRAHHGVKVGDHVRISKVKGAFKNGCLPNWTEEVFTVSRLLDTEPPQVKVKDYNGEEVVGSFYLPEIQLVDKPEVYRIEKSLEERKRRGKKEYLVKWLGYPASFNEWISQEKIEQIGDGS